MNILGYKKYRFLNKRIYGGKLDPPFYPLLFLFLFFNGCIKDFDGYMVHCVWEFYFKAGALVLVIKVSDIYLFFTDYLVFIVKSSGH